MPRAAKLCRHRGHWYTKAGNPSGTYFGRCKEVSHADAKLQFREYLAALKNKRSPRLPEHSVIRICAAHLRWVRGHRSDALFRQRRSLLKKFCHHIVGSGGKLGLDGQGAPLGFLRAAFLTRAHVDDYLELRGNHSDGSPPIADKTHRAIVIAIKACWNWAADSVEDGGGQLLPENHRPLAKLKRGFVVPKDLTEADLPTDEEIETLFSWTRIDLSKVRDADGRWRERRPDEYTSSTAPSVLADMLRVYYATGARTGELCQAQVRDLMPRTRQLCLGKHKRVRTQKNPALRNIQLSRHVLEILQRNAQGKQPHDALFTRANGKAWTQGDVNERLRAVKKAAAAHGKVVRRHITPYSFRDLYISELLMIGTPIFKVAKMAGTSFEEIDRTYGHFFNEDLAAAQEKLDAERHGRFQQTEPRTRNGAVA